MSEDKSTTSKSIGDTSNPFQLQSSDHPGASLVSKPLNGDNYATWSKSMGIALSAKNKTGFIDGSIKKSSTYDEKFAGWKRCNDMMLSWIPNSIDPSLLDSVIYAKLVSDVWADLKDRFSQNNAPRIFQLQREIASSHQETMSVTTYYSKMKGLWDELASHNDLSVMQFLMGLNDTYSAIRGQILLMQPLPSIGKLYTILREVMMANARRSRGYTQQKGRSKLHCTHCNGTNHTVDKWYHLHRFLSGHKHNKKSGDGEVKKPNQSIANNVHTEMPTFTQEQ
ncbi:hypothetical protein Pfo_011457 [Paulownia fortunei]|nr:hypothetical protein Pfo_011457 [Paulownia fortunei]